MKIVRSISDHVPALTCAAPNARLTAVLIALVGFSVEFGLCRAQQPDADAAGVQVLTRGPVHEAFAGTVTFNPEPGIVVTKAPPSPIEEVPPEERPEGDNVTWIPGYWAWDDERSDFLWVSGTWRALPPGREWMAGYWGQTAQGYQWTSGYWADATAPETSYLPEPPATVEAGPNIEAPSTDYGWTPGCWLWYQGHYAWRPGYWAQGQADWDWTPAHYVWTPRGYIFVEGYWDYSVERRGMLFAPVYFGADVYSRRGYSYSPTIVISLGVFADHLFLRPSYQHYYFGDYYAANYARNGFYASFSFQSSRHGYDPFYSHQRWEHRDDRDWEQRTAASYQYRRDNVSARPPRTWTAQRSIDPGRLGSDQNHVLVAAPIDQVAKRTNGAVRFQPVARDERQALVQRGQEVQKSRDQRRTIEAKTEITVARKTGAVVEPVRVQLPRSPIVAKPGSQQSRNLTPPRVPQAPKPDTKIQSNSATLGRPPTADRATLQSQSRKLEPGQKPAPGPSEPTSRAGQVQPQPPSRANTAGTKPVEQSQRNAGPAAQKSAPQIEQRANHGAANVARDSRQNPQALEKKAQQESAQRTTDSAAKAQVESQQNARALVQKTQQDSARRANDAAATAAEYSRRDAATVEKKNQQQSVQRATESAAKAQVESRQNVRAREQKTQQDSERRANDAAAKAAENSQRNTRALEKKNQESTVHAKESAVQVQQESPRNTRAPEQQAQRSVQPPAKSKPAEDGRNAKAPSKRTEKNDGEAKPEDTPRP